jgi:ATP-dependent DNA helicase DinG
MQKAGIVIVNHALFFSDLALPQDSRLLGDYEVAVLDEAHTLEGVASDHFGSSVSEAQVDRLLRDLYNERTDRGLLALMGARDAVSSVNLAFVAADAFFGALADCQPPAISSGGRIRTPGAVPNTLSPALMELGAALVALRKQTHDEDQGMELLAASVRCVETAERIESLLLQKEPDYAYWVLRGGTGASRPGAASGAQRSVTLSGAPIQVGPILKRGIFDALRSAVLTSATLATSRQGQHGFDYLRGRLGLEGGEEILLTSPFDYRKQAKLYIETGLGDPNSQ